MFGDCFGTNIPDSGHVLPAGCFFTGSGFALATFFAGGAFFAAAAFVGAFFAGALAGAFLAAALAGAAFFAAAFAGTAFFAAAFAGTAFFAAAFAGTAFFATGLAGAVFFATAFAAGAAFFATAFFAAAPCVAFVFLVGAAFFTGALAIEHRSGGGNRKRGTLVQAPDRERCSVWWGGALRPRRSTPRSRRARGACPGTVAGPRRLRRVAAPASGRPGMGFLRGPAARERPSRHPPRLGPPVQGHLPAFPHHAGQVRREEGRVGLPRPAGGGGGREGARLLGKAPDRGLRHRGLQPALPGVGAAVRGGLVGADQPDRDVARSLRRLHDDEQRVHRERVVAVPRALGQGPDLRGLEGGPLLRPVRDRALEPR